VLERGVRPEPLSPFLQETIRRAREACQKNARRVGMSRREFLLSICGAATTLAPGPELAEAYGSAAASSMAVGVKGSETPIRLMPPTGTRGSSHPRHLAA